MGSVLYVGWNGGYVGKAIGDGLISVVGGIAYVLPVACVADRRADGRAQRPAALRPVPHRPRPDHASALALVLGRAHGGYLGKGLESLFGSLIGTTGTRILGAFLLVAGVLLVSGASAGAFLRRSGHAMRSAARRPARSPRGARRAPPSPEPAPVFAAAPPPPVDGVAGVPGRRPAGAAARPRAGARAGARGSDTQTSLFDVTETDGEDTVYTLPTGASCAGRSRPRRAPPSPSARVAEVLVQALANFGVDATVVGEIAGPRVTRYELQLAPGTKVSKVAGLKDDLSYALATTEIRILAPIPGKQAVGVEVPNHSPNLVTLGDVYDELPATSSPLSVWLGKDISGHAIWTDLARMPHLLIAGTTGSGKSGCINTILTSILLRATPGRRADDPDRPEADRAQLLRVDPAPAHAGRLVAEEGGRRARERRRGDGAPLRAHEPRPRALAARR